MSIRDRLRDWLGITDLEASKQKVEEVPVLDIDHAKRMVEEAIIQAFEVDRSQFWRMNDIPIISHYWDSPYKDIRGMVEGRIRAVYEDHIQIQAKKAIDDILEPEEFIDTFVERIKKKQVIA